MSADIYGMYGGNVPFEDYCDAVGGCPSYRIKKIDRFYYHLRLDNVLKERVEIRSTDKDILFQGINAYTNKKIEVWIPKKLIKRDIDTLYIWNGFRLHENEKVLQ